MPLTVETCAARHRGDRTEQQDRVALFAHPTRPGMILAVLADGMGGHTGGAMAAEQVVIKAKENFDAFRPQSETAESLLESIVNEAHLVIKLTRFTSEQDPHSTAVVFVLQPGEANWAHCGDSRIYHFRGANLVARSADHSLVGEMQRQGKLTEEEALVHPQRNVLLSCLGSPREPRIAYGSAAPLMAGDSFLLCSDGLWAYFSDEELGAALSALSAREAARVLVDNARARAGGYGDNISLAIIKVVETQDKPGRRPAA